MTFEIEIPVLVKNYDLACIREIFWQHILNKVYNLAKLTTKYL